MAGKAARRNRRDALEADDVDELADLAIDDDRRPTRPSLLTRFVAWVDQTDQADSSTRMQGRDPQGAYAASAVLVVLPLVFIAANATHHGAALASPVFQAAGLIFGLLTAASVRLANRIVTPLVAIISVLLTGTQTSAIPHSLQYLTEVDLVVGMATVIVLTMRQSRARGAMTASRRAAARGSRPAARSGQAPAKRGAKKAEDPAGPPPSRRYTPPKNRSSA